MTAALRVHRGFERTLLPLPSTLTAIAGAISRGARTSHRYTSVVAGHFIEPSICAGNCHNQALYKGHTLPDYKWKPIEPLSDSDRAIDLADIQPLYDSWRTAKERLSESSPDNLDDFSEKLIRRLSIETGILERIYDLDRGTTEALVAKGFIEELVSRSSTDIEPSRLIDILRDQEAGVQLIMDCIAKTRKLSVAVVNELHALLTRHQDTTTAVDQFGTRINIPLEKGILKTQPNNPRRPDGSIHEYCPPVHVASEMENLLSWLTDYEAEDPVIVAAWAHHRFTQIHPYQDGNGRVARALTSFIFLKAGLLPLVIDRDLRSDYLDSLEIADSGKLTFLAELFARLERNAILQALSVDVDSESRREQSLTTAVIESLAAKFDRRREQKHQEFRGVSQLARDLRSLTQRQVEEAFNALKAPMRYIGDPDIHITQGGSDFNNAHWYKHDVIKSSEASGKFVNFNEEHVFLKSSIRVARERLVFVVSMHHVGRDLTGIMEITAFARLESFEESDDRESVSADFSLCSLDPFVITWKTNEADVTEAYRRWLDSALAVAIKDYGDRL